MHSRQSTMATSSKSAARVGSAEKLSPVPHTRIEDERMIEEIYDVGIKLGQGNFGVVKEVIHKKTQEKWACKQVNKEKAGSSAIKLLEREVAILKKVHHEHIIRLKEVFETSKKMYLVMEYCDGGELADVLKAQGTFSEVETKTIMERLASAISYLHKNDMVHRDLKLENILLARNPQDSSDNLYIKVTDFGLSVVKGGVGHENMMMDFCGTPMYMAPEIIDNKMYSEKCDIWAMGVIMYTLLCGSPPFQSKDEEKLYEIIKNADIQKLFQSNPVWKNISNEAKDLIEGLLTIDPAHRITASEMRDHPWITGRAMEEESKRPRNVLEMMREWRNDLTNGSSADDGAINGNESQSGAIVPEDKEKNGSSQVTSAATSRVSSAGNLRGKTTPSLRMGRRASLPQTPIGAGASNHIMSVKDMNRNTRRNSMGPSSLSSIPQGYQPSKGGRNSKSPSADTTTRVGSVQSNHQSVRNQATKTATLPSVSKAVPPGGKKKK